ISLMVSKKHEIIFRVNDETMTFKVGRGMCCLTAMEAYLWLRRLFRRLMIRKGKLIMEEKGHPKKKKPKSKWVKQYLCGSKEKKRVRNSRSRDGSPIC
ncbi:hypothetical protein HAX54_052667, partial [Datura stramonium]|nr:hypothetical protein [Datura stramonium]